MVTAIIASLHQDTTHEKCAMAYGLAANLRTESERARRLVALEAEIYRDGVLPAICADWATALREAPTHDEVLRELEATRDALERLHQRLDSLPVKGDSKAGGG